MRRECGLPDTAASVPYNPTVTQPTDAGDLRLYPTGARPLASVTSYAAGQTRANNGIVPLAADGSFATWVGPGDGHRPRDP